MPGRSIAREKVLAIVERELAKGHTRESAAAVADISRSTLDRWLADDEVRERVIKAEDRGEKTVVDLLLQAAHSGNVAASIFWLKARRGWREVQRVEYVDQTPVDPFIRMDPSARQRLEDEARKARSEIDALVEEATSAPAS